MKPHEKVHLQVDIDLDVKYKKRYKGRNNNDTIRGIWCIRSLHGSHWISWKDPRHRSVCGIYTPKYLARRGELAKITCSYCRKYYLKYIGAK